ncbi:putative titin-like [Triplophysa rosa]|uniref:Titin-like n=1 Tax=Triplophysa rosa TaxID=992332 RepID=A0A9W7TDP4_TRIRA|nr:putative titin-like [Triplophysa rosa]
MEMFQIIFLTVAVSAQVSPPTVKPVTTNRAIPTAKLTLEPALAVFYPSDNVTLKCEIEGSSDDWSYKWRNNKGFLQESKSRLEITLKSMDDSGEYTCQPFIKDRVTAEMSSAVTLQVNAIPTAKLTLEPALAVFYPSENVTLKCEIEGSSDDWSYKWRNNKGFLQESKSPLEITLKSMDDSGEYTCQPFIKDRVTTEMSSAVTLQVNETPRPKLTADPNWTEFFPNETITLTCGFDGNSDGWSFEWLKINETLKTSSTLTITAKPSDSGRYSCKGKLRSVVSQQSDAFQLNVKDQWPKPNLTQSQNVQVFYKGETITFNCKVEVRSLNLEYLFFRDSVQIHANTSNSFSIQSAQVSHSGKYLCQVKRRTLSSGQSDVRTVTVKEIPQAQLNSEWKDAFPGETVSLQCVIPGVSENWIYMWFRNEKTVSSGPDTNVYGNTLSLSVKSHHTGLYMYVCQAQLERRSVTSAKSTQHSLNIYEPPQPKLSIESEWKMFYRSEKITLKCSINKNPNDWLYEWYKNKSPLPEAKDTLLINSADISHSGSYKCKGKHQQRSKVTTSETQALQIHIYDKTPKPDIKEHPSFEFFYTDERIHLDCNMSGDGWEYHWNKDSKPTQPSITNTNYTINSASLHHTGVYKCEAKRGDFSIYSEPLKVEVQARLSAVLTLGTELSDIMAGSVLTLRCEVSDGKEWNYTWSENGQELNESSHTLKVKATEDTIKNEFKCRGKRTVRPLYSSWSEGFVANNTVFKRKILLAISGFFICCIVILIIGCIVLKITRKPVKKETLCEDLFISMADSKNQATTPLMEYMENKPKENESEEKEELIMDHISVTHVDGVIKGKDSPSAEANGLTSFKGIDKVWQICSI